MPKPTQSVPTASQETIVYPVITGGTHERVLSDADIDRLQKISEVEFKEDMRRALRSIAAAWRHHDRALQSPRPKEFCARLKNVEIALKKGAVLLEFDDAADSLDYQLKNWLLNSRFEGASDLLNVSASVYQQINALIGLLRRAQENLPKDMGRARPKDEDRFIIYLANQFEASGGKALAYRTGNRSIYALTNFRIFIHQFYELLALVSRRTESGLDEAIIRALRYRRKQQKECSPA